MGFPVAQRVKHPPAMQETQVWSLGQEDPLEKQMATHFSIHAWRIPWMEAIVHGVTKSLTRLSNFTFTLYRWGKRETKVMFSPYIWLLLKKCEQFLKGYSRRLFEKILHDPLNFKMENLENQLKLYVDCDGFFI